MLVKVGKCTSWWLTEALCLRNAAYIVQLEEHMYTMQTEALIYTTVDVAMGLAALVPAVFQEYVMLMIACYCRITVCYYYGDG